VLSDDWSTQNTRVNHLLQVLLDADLYDAANYLNVNVLGLERIERPTLPGNMPSLQRPCWGDENNKLAKENFNDYDYKKYPYNHNKVCDPSLDNYKGSRDSMLSDYSSLKGKSVEQGYEPLGLQSRPDGNKVSYDSGDLSYPLQALQARSSGDRQQPAGQHEQVCFPKQITLYTCTQYILFFVCWCKVVFCMETGTHYSQYWQRISLQYLFSSKEVLKIYN